jgi:hypothetical protein
MRLLIAYSLIAAVVAWFVFLMVWKRRNTREAKALRRQSLGKRDD